MGQRGVVLDGIAKALNAGGSALVRVYDTVSSITTDAGKGEQGNLKTPAKKAGESCRPKVLSEREKLDVQIREYEQKMAPLFCEIGKAVAEQESVGALPAAAEAAMKQVSEYRAEIEKIRRFILELEEKERAAAAAAKAAEEEKARVAAEAAKAAAEEKARAEAEARAAAEEKAKAEAALKEAVALPAPAIEDAETGEPELLSEIDEHAHEQQAVAPPEPTPSTVADLPPEMPTIAEEPVAAVTEEVSSIPAATSETPEPELLSEIDQHEPAQETSASAEPIGNETSADGETKAPGVPVEMIEMLKDDLLKLCEEKGIAANKRMTKVEILELLQTN